jgi:hypothetical protein
VVQEGEIGIDVANETVYYAIVRDDRAVNDASGLARRTHTPHGRLDEAIRRNLTWERDSAIYDWERGEELGTTLVQISEAEAERLIERFRQKWGEQG